MDKYHDDLMVLDGLLKPEIADKQLYSMAKSMVGEFCIPPGANVAKAIVVGCGWLKNNPANGDRPASLALNQAYRETWKCK